ncbi:hypothetical protein EG835_02570 [bacterium]|nr:hypothetical protein [bacterium]
MFHRIRSFLNRHGQTPDTVAPATPTQPADARRQWQEQAQEGELEFHKHDDWRPSEDFMRQTHALFASFGFDPDAWAGKTIVDLGAGSRLRTKYFADANLVAVEPLGDRFMAEISWCDLGDAAAVYARPAEELIDELVGEADLLISINVLDHCFDFSRILQNIRDYLRPDGIAFLSFDRHEVPDEMHPLILTEDVCAREIAAAGLEIARMSKGASGLAGNSQTYGHGDYALNYWLQRPTS